MICVGVVLLGVFVWIVILLGFLVGFFGGVFWGGILGWFKSMCGSYEVIMMIMFNFVVVSLVNFVVFYVIKNFFM